MGHALRSFQLSGSTLAAFLGGRLAMAGEAMLAGIRERVYQRCLPLATEKLLIRTGSDDERLGATGAAMLAMDEAISAANWGKFTARPGAAAG